jgi:hypothetical protein
MAKAAAPAKSPSVLDDEPVPKPDLALTTTPTPSPARVLLDEQLIHEADLAQALGGKTVRAVSNLAKKHGLRRVTILRRVYYRKEGLRDFLARVGQKPARRRRTPRP